MKKNLIIIVSLLAVIIAGGITTKVLWRTKQPATNVAATPTPAFSTVPDFVQTTPIATTSSGWKTYSTSLNCYSFSVPADWKVIYQKFEDKNDCAQKLNAIASSQENGHTYYFSIAGGGQAGSDLLPGETLRRSTITLNGSSFVVQTRTQKGETQPYIIIVAPEDTKVQYAKGPLIFFDGIHGTEEHHPVLSESQIQQFNQILSTLQFNN